MKNTVDEREIQAFSKDAGHWWDSEGPFKPLHRLNPVRMKYIKEQICAAFDLDTSSLKPLNGLKILDIGCGGGLVCEPLARMGGNVTGADADPVAIEVARKHAEHSGLEIEYLNKSSEELLHSHPERVRSGPARLSTSKNEESHSSSGDPSTDARDDRHLYDAVLALEIIEHVSDPAAFVENCARLCKPGGLVIFSTLNRTPKSYALGIIAAEYILRWVPQGTHSWKKFIKPSELSRFARAADLEVHAINGLIFNPLKGEFSISKTDLDVNYFLVCKRI